MGALEALQNVAGEQRPRLFKRIAPESSKFSMLMYGERLRDQLENVVEALASDSTSRQAVAQVWWPGDLGSGDESNLCTIGLQLIARDGRLHCFTHMRSNDAWWGMAYDLFQFAQVQASVANCLGLDLGWYVHSANSAHLYERHFEAARQLEPPVDRPPMAIRGVGRPGFSWSHIVDRARLILDGVLPIHPTGSERWLHVQLRPYQ
jgi:thymidylate synthase